MVITALITIPGFGSVTVVEHLSSQLKNHRLDSIDLRNLLKFRQTMKQLHAEKCTLLPTIEIIAGSQSKPWRSGKKLHFY